jgi:hypothetical protein
VKESPCLDGTSTIMVDRNNSETERKVRNAAVKAIKGDVSALLEEIRIAPQGDLTNLLASIPEELRSLWATDGGGGPLSVLLVSDLTSSAPTGDCLDLEAPKPAPSSPPRSSRAVSKPDNSSLCRMTSRCGSSGRS